MVICNNIKNLSGQALIVLTPTVNLTAVKISPTPRSDPKKVEVFMLQNVNISIVISKNTK